jgi:hypothetical protein
MTPAQDHALSYGRTVLEVYRFPAPREPGELALALREDMRDGSPNAGQALGYLLDEFPEIKTETKGRKE